MAVNREDLEVPFYLVLDDSDLNRGLDEVASKLKNTGKIVENEFIKRFSDAEDKFQTIVKLGDKVYSVVGKLNKQGKMDKRTKLSVTPLENLSEAKTLLYSKKLSQYNDNKEKLAIKRAEDARKKQEQEQAKLDKKAQKQEIKQESLNNLMSGYSKILQDRSFTSAQQFKDIGKEITKAIGKGMADGLDLTEAFNAESLFQNESQRIKANAMKIGEVFKGILSPMQIAKIQLSEVRSAMKVLQEDMMAVTDPTMLSKYSEELKGLAKQASKLEKQTKDGPLTTLINRFKSYGLLRIVRTFFMSVEKGLGESINSLSVFDEGFKDSLSSITSQFQIMSSSLSVMLAPILEMLVPVVEKITKGFAEFANTISYLMAKLLGNATYLKVNTEYMKEFNKEASKFSFDKFEALTQEQEIDPESMFTKAKVEDGMGEGMERISFLLAEISTALIGIGTLKVMSWIMSGDAKKFFGGLKDDLKGIKGKIDDLSTAGLIAGSAFAFAVTLINLIDVIKNWDSQSLITKITAITAAALALAAVVFSILAAIPAIGHTAVFKALSVGAIAAATLAGTVSIMKFADGGMPEQGSLFVAGEAGAELVTTMPSGQTGVTNIAQFKQAVVEGLYEWWSDAKYDLPESSTPSFDGASIASSKSFINEFNRRNAGMKIR